MKILRSELTGFQLQPIHESLQVIASRLQRLHLQGRNLAKLAVILFFFEMNWGIELSFDFLEDNTYYEHLAMNVKFETFMKSFSDG